jgi:hypothetical protein
MLANIDEEPYHQSISMRLHGRPLAGCRPRVSSAITDRPMNTLARLPTRPAAVASASNWQVVGRLGPYWRRAHAEEIGCSAVTAPDGLWVIPS